MDKHTAQHCNGYVAIRSKTILVLDTFINVLVDELNKLKHNEVRDILIDKLNHNLPESRRYLNRKLRKSLKHLLLENRAGNLKLAMISAVQFQL